MMEEMWPQLLQFEEETCDGEDVREAAHIKHLHTSMLALVESGYFTEFAPFWNGMLLGHAVK